MNSAIKSPITLESIAASIALLPTKDDVVGIVRKEATEIVRKEATVIVNGAINELAHVVSNGFTRIENRLDNLEEKFEKLETRVSVLHSSLSNQIDNIYINYVKYDEFSKLSHRVKVLEGNRKK